MGGQSEVVPPSIRGLSIRDRQASGVDKAVVLIHGMSIKGRQEDEVRASIGGRHVSKTRDRVNRGQTTNWAMFCNGHITHTQARAERHRWEGGQVFEACVSSISICVWTM